MNDEHVLLCLAVAPGYVPPVESVRDICSKCGVGVWRALSSSGVAKAVCMDCGLELMRHESEIALMPLSERQIKEIRQYGQQPPLGNN